MALRLVGFILALSDVYRFIESFCRFVISVFVEC